MNRHHLALFASITFLWNFADAADRQSLPGFQQFRFGMSEQELRQLSPLIIGSTEAAGAWFLAAKPVSIEGVDYQVKLLLKSGKLDRINVEDDRQEDSAVSCMARFDQIYGIVRANYGTPDDEPKSENISSLLTIRSARFTFRDGGSVIVAASFLLSFGQPNNLCSTWVSYSAGHAGNGGGTF